MQSRSERHKQANGAIVERGIFAFEGQEYAALGSVIDEKRGVLVGYPVCGVLQTWDGKPIAALKITGYARGSSGERLTCWACEYNGQRYSGRNSGEHMVLKLRAKRNGLNHR